ncbi:uncharacterized protein LOC109729037 [Ananas comosus]|uniref:Uncharacterized protein LOC109729037 n=1 Tax=Ananas comosus TaxID=4615 RepID=A0A6P5H2R3_ANACO|nr:uncharacterized protein LOC109729037 [Ananas comosus]
MAIPIADKTLTLPTSLISPQLPPLRLNPIFLRNLTFSSASSSWNRKPMAIAVSSTISTSSDANPYNYGGWDDVELVDGSDRSGKVDSIRSFLVSLGVHEGKHGFLFVLGFISAFAVSRVRVSPVVVVPISVLVFVAGFAAGSTQKSIVSRNDSEIRAYDEKHRNLRAILNEVEVKISDLRNGLENIRNSGQLDLSKIKNLVEVVEHIGIKVGYGRKFVEFSNPGDVLDDNMDIESERWKKSNQKTGQKKTKFEAIAVDLVQYLGGLIKENINEFKPSKSKDGGNKQELSDQPSLIREKNINSADAMKGNAIANDNSSNPSLVETVKNKLEQDEVFSGKTERKALDKLNSGEELPFDTTQDVINEMKNSESRGKRYSSDMLSYDEEGNDLNMSLHFMSKQASFERMVIKHRYGQMIKSDIHDPADYGTNPRARETTRNMDFFKKSEELSQVEQTLEIRNSNKLKAEQIGGTTFRKAKPKANSEYRLEQAPNADVTEKEVVSSSPTVSSDEEFNQNVKKATELLKRARGCMASKADEETADALLYKTARLLSTAVALKPTSLLAVGQLGNTFLLHGELKLKVSRELRTLLSRSDVYLRRERPSILLKKLDRNILSRESVASVLVDVCEECEGLLVEAGRKYRIALSIDGTDVKALYNWGLALSFRAQLIADIGPEAALDADKVYLAAIDKFDAMLSRENAYAPAALYRWGVALQQRSHLRHRSNREKAKLLQQAKSLFEDVLCVEADNRLVREALSSCISELNYNGQWP